MPTPFPNPRSNPAFEARRLASASGWYVRVAWLNGKRDHIPGFVSQREAQHWIEEKAPEVVVGAGQHARASFCGLATALTRVIGDAFSLRTVIGTSASAANRLSGTSFIGTHARGKTTLLLAEAGIVERAGWGCRSKERPDRVECSAAAQQVSRH